MTVEQLAAAFEALTSRETRAAAAKLGEAMRAAWAAQGGQHKVGPAPRGPLERDAQRMLDRMR